MVTHEISSLYQSISQTKSGISDQSTFDVLSLLAEGHCSEYLAVYAGETDLIQPTLLFPELLTCSVNSCTEQSSHWSSGVLPFTSNLLGANT